MHPVTWRDTAQQLSVARDAFLEGRWGDAKKLADEVAPDCEWKRCTRKRRHPTPMVDDYWWSDQDYDDEVDELPIATTPMIERRRIRVQEWRRIDWLTWINPLATTTFDATLRAAYPVEAVTAMAAQSHPLARCRSLVGGEDAIEMRIRSYANIVMPQWNGVFKVDV